ncbi:Hypothetical predicted protein [Mytilus galloprovincialis]|uniref:Uncharacterized protein n=1 Tax=Mytilus galloprovincialis TaxID=29158 RepID=A0A8B6G2F2_MYTGA|nr:Hypothetical predicted protein [Mytilus galloprovincialis]
MSDVDTDKTATDAHPRGEAQPTAPSSDIHVSDAFHLFPDYLDYKLVDLKADLASDNRTTQSARPDETVPNSAYSQSYSRYSQPPQPFRAGYGRREPAHYDMCYQYKQFGH